MGDRRFVIIALLAGTFHPNYGCEIVDHPLWMVPIQTSIFDTHDGIVISRATTDIQGINSVSYGQATLGGPYFDILIRDSQLVVETNDAFRRYEEVEVASRVAITVDVDCIGGSTRSGLILWIDITDTNNNRPEFLPADQYEFVVTPPLPPGFLITGCFNDLITVRDIDLTTQRIDFTIEDNPYFEIFYDPDSSTVPKHFNAQIRTKSFVRSLNEPLDLRITATDVDLTEGPPLTATATVRVVPDTEFQYPEEPVFSAAFYLASYADDEVTLADSISLKQGLDEFVQFSLEGEYEEYFEVTKQGDQVLLMAVKPLPEEVELQRQILLVVRATREFTSGDTATIIVQFPEVTPLEFENAIYDGTITENLLRISPLVLSQGYDGETVSARVVGEHASYFSAAVNRERVTLTMEALPDEIINSNSFISLQIVASTPRSSAYTVVNLDIIKDDKVTPTFDQYVYRGSYHPTTGLTLEQNIQITQGFDETVKLELVGEYKELFQIVGTGSTVTLSATIPPELFSLQNILISIEATKPRTVGANAAIYITLPAARELGFEESSYRGSIEDGVLSLQSIRLSRGYEDGVSFYVTGEYSSYFTTSSDREEVWVVLERPLPDSIITQNRAIMLTLAASGDNALPAYTNILLDIIKYDVNTPVFAQPVYVGMSSGAEVDMEDIILTQGFDDSVVFGIEGAHAEYFAAQASGDRVVIRQRAPVPKDVVFAEKVLVFSLFAHKPWTVGGRATVLITFPPELTDLTVMRFSQNAYVGSLEENEIRLENIVLETGFAAGTEFILTGEHAEHFQLSGAGSNTLRLTTRDTLPRLEPKLLTLDIEARRPRASPAWTTVVLEIVEPTLIAPMFSQAYYTGVYRDGDLVLAEMIRLSEGYDDTVTFALSQDASDWFDIQGFDNSLTLTVKAPLPSEVLENNKNLVFEIIATKPSGLTGRAVIVIELSKDISDSSLRFEQNVYKGYLESSGVTLEEISIEDHSVVTNYQLIGDYAENFDLTYGNGKFEVQLRVPIASEVLEQTSVFILTLEASDDKGNASTIIVLENLRASRESIEFEKAYYLGTYATSIGLQFDSVIKLTTEVADVEYDLEGEDSQWFGLEIEGSTVRVVLRNPIPADILEKNRQLVFVVTAQTPGSSIARTAVVVSLSNVSQPEADVSFNKIYYEGVLENGILTHESITITGIPETPVELRGEYSSQFSTLVNAGAVTVFTSGTLTLPDDVTHIVLEMHADTAYAVLLITVPQPDPQPGTDVSFDKVYYHGELQDGVLSHEAVTIRGFSGSEIELRGEYSSQFSSAVSGGAVTVSAAGTLTLPDDITHIVLEMHADTAYAVLLITVPQSDSQPGSDVSFDKLYYEGVLENGIIVHDVITLTGYSGSSVELLGEYSSQFTSTVSGGVVTVSPASTLTLPDDVTQVLLEMHADTAYAFLLIRVPRSDLPPESDVFFDKTFYEGSIQNGNLIHDPIIINGFTGSGIELRGEYSSQFSSAVSGGAVTVSAAGTLTLPDDVTHIVLEMHADTAYAVLLITVPQSDLPPASDVSFDRVVYDAVLQNGVVVHDTITLKGFSGSTVELKGEYSSQFSSQLSDGVVTVSASSSLTLPDDVTHIVLEMHADTAYAVLLLTVPQSDEPGTIRVSFERPSYAFLVSTTHTGPVGAVQAAASNGEPVTYSLLTTNAALQGTVSINSAGEIFLSSTEERGLHDFQVVATAVSSLVRGTTTVHLAVEDVTTCDDGLSPLIVLDVDEEEPHHNLIPDYANIPENCRFALTNRWPVYHDWVYIDDTGLHTTAIDREDQSIAFMPVSQIQVELVLRCDGDISRTRRSSGDLGPYDYGSSDWILTESIPFDARRSLVSIIVNDINDNAPIFVGKENEPVVVGYPVPELVQRVSPRALVELQATDADIGENAALLYWSSAPQLAVASTTGSVHLRDGAVLENGIILTVNATDQNGQGLTGSIEILVRLLDQNNIAVVTVKDAFLDDEETVVSTLSDGLGYDLKVLRSVVVSGGEEQRRSRWRRDITSSGGASLQMYVYGLLAAEPVSVERLTTDISDLVAGSVIVASSVSLRDHLEGQQICVVSARDTGLLVATIVLSVLLLIALLAIAVWFFLRWRRNKNYDQFSDENSLPSNDAEDNVAKPELPKPRLDIAELKRSERRLQEMLDTPIEAISVEPSGSKTDEIVNIPQPQIPVVIQSIDKLKDADDLSEDEFGEVKTPRRKSMVTFNENVEKIIHLEDTPDADDADSEPEIEVYKF